MVDALRRARALLRPGGFVLDLHPTADRATIVVGTTTAGVVDAGDAPERHQRACEAIDAVVREGLFVIEQSLVFDFSLYADTIDELQEHIVEDWNDARIGDETMARARALIAALPDAAVRVRERVRVTRLKPTA